MVPAATARRWLDDHKTELEGGILQYLEETGGAHDQGRCFVFDEREALGSDLSALRD